MYVPYWAKTSALLFLIIILFLFCFDKGETKNGEKIGRGEKNRCSWRRQKCYHNHVYVFFHRFHTHALQIWFDFFSCLWQNVYTIFSRAGPSTRHCRLASGPPHHAPRVHKMHFHQWELKCTLAVFLYKFLD